MLKISYIMKDLAARDYHFNAERIFDALDVRDNTRREYKQRIVHFTIFVESNGFNLNTLLDYKRFLAANEQYSISTRNKYLTCARIFLKECHRLGLIDRDITVNIKCFEQNKKHKVDGLTEQEASQVCDWIRSNPDKLRERAMLCLLLFQGLRQSEVCRLKISDIRLADKTIMVLGKGRDDKEKVYLHPATAKALRAYLRSLKRKPDDYIFMSKSIASADTRLTECGLRIIIKSVLAELDIEKTVHGFRHYFTSQLIRSMPGELTVVSKFTRHRSLEMLQVYNDNLLMEKDVQRFYKAFNANHLATQFH